MELKRQNLPQLQEVIEKKKKKKKKTSTETTGASLAGGCGLSFHHFICSNGMNVAVAVMKMNVFAIAIMSPLKLQ